MSELKINYAANPLTPYIRLTKKGNDYTLWVIVPLPIGYYLRHDNNPEIINDKENDQVLVRIYIEGARKSQTDEWYAVPLKINLPSPDSNSPIRIDGKTPIITTVYLGDPEDEGSTVTKYEEAEDGG